MVQDVAAHVGPGDLPNELGAQRVGVDAVALQRPLLRGNGGLAQDHEQNGHGGVGQGDPKRHAADLGHGEREVAKQGEQRPHPVDAAVQQRNVHNRVPELLEVEKHGDAGEVGQHPLREVQDDHVSEFASRSMRPRPVSAVMSAMARVSASLSASMFA